MQRIVLASGSPRRKELLALLGWEFDILPAEQEEIIRGGTPADIVMELSLQKALEVSARTQEEMLVIGADTMVALSNQVMGKPEDEAQACHMLQKLQGQIHQVYTGVTLVYGPGQRREQYTFYERTNVEMYPMTQEQIRDYVRTGEPMDKAGAYAIQGIAARYVKQIQGEYNNVVGLPVARLYQEMYRRGLV